MPLRKIRRAAKALKAGAKKYAPKAKAAYAKAKPKAKLAVAKARHHVKTHSTAYKAAAAGVGVTAFASRRTEKKRVKRAALRGYARGFREGVKRKRY